MRTTILSFIYLALLSVTLTAHAASSGGGGLPSTSAPPRERVDPAQAYRDGLAALEARDYREAEKQFKIVLRADSRHGGGNYYMGLALIGRDKAKSARRYLERAVKYAGDLPDPHRDLGFVYLALGDKKKAAAEAEALAALREKCNSGCDAKVIAEIEAAQRALEAAIASDDKEAARKRLGAIDLPRTQQGDVAYLDAVGHINRTDYRAAIASLEQSSMAIGPHADIFTYLGFAYRKLGAYETARSYYGRALTIYPEHKGANEYLGELYVEAGELEKARVMLAKLEEICSFGCIEREELARWISAAGAE